MRLLLKWQGRENMTDCEKAISNCANMLQYWAGLIAKAECRNPLSARDGLLLRKVPLELQLAPVKLVKNLAVVLQGNVSKDIAESLLDAWSNGLLPLVQNCLQSWQQGLLGDCLFPKCNAFEWELEPSTGLSPENAKGLCAQLSMQSISRALNPQKHHSSCSWMTLD